MSADISPKRAEIQTDADKAAIRRTRNAEIASEPDSENYLARTIYEDHDLIDIGIMDPDGNRIMARKRIEVGFVRWPAKS